MHVPYPPLAQPNVPTYAVALSVRRVAHPCIGVAAAQRPRWQATLERVLPAGIRLRGPETPIERYMNAIFLSDFASFR
jgi:hypothetical protein